MRDCDNTIEELGKRVMDYMEIENSDWSYKFWFMTPAYWRYTSPQNFGDLENISEAKKIIRLLQN